MSKNDIGIKIGVEGEREFKSNLRDINTTMKTLGSEMKVVAAQFDKNDKSTEALTARNKVLNKEIEAQKEKIETLKNALSNASQSFGDADSRTQKWQQELNNATAGLIKMEKELDQNNDELKKSENRFANAKEKAHDFGEKMKKVGDVVKTACKAMAATIGAIGTAVVAAGKKLTQLANETAEHGNEIDKYRQKLGMSAEAYQEWDYVLSQADVDITSMTTGLKTMTNQIDDAKNGSEKAAERFRKLGISTQDLQKMSREDVFNAVIKGFQGMSDSTERAALANDLFGKSGQNLTPLFNESAASTEALKQKAHELGYVMSDEAVSASAQYMDSLDNLKKSFEGLKNNIMGELLPGFSLVFEGLSGLMAGTDGAEETLKKGAEELSDEIGQVFPRIATIITTLLTTVLEIAPAIIKSLLEGIFANLPQLVDAATSIIVTLVDGITSNFSVIAEAALTIVLTLGESIISNLPIIIESGLQVIIELAHGISEALPQLIPTIVQVVLEIVTTLLDNLDELVSAAIEIILALAQGLIDAIPLLIDYLPEIIAKVVEQLILLSPQLLSAAIQIIFQLGEGLIKCIPSLLAYLPRLISSMVSALIDAAKSFLRIGRNMVEGIWNGISNSIQWIKDKIKGWVGNVLSFIKNIFGIHSPSTVMRDQVGTFLAKGLGEGFVDEMDNVRQQMADALPTSFDIRPNINSTLAVARETVGNSSIVGGINLSVNLSIGEFVNNRKEDINDLADELSVILASKVKRRSEAFG